MSKYGLQIRVKPSEQRIPPRPQVQPIAGFLDDDDDDIEREISRQASKNKSLKDTEELHKKALEEDPSVFDYDEVYDDMKQKAVLPMAKDRVERKSKYIQTIMEHTKKRERENDIVFERRLLKERSKEDHLYEGKEKFVTGGYKRKLAEQAKWKEEERLRQIQEERDDITKKGDMSDFYFNLSKNVAFGAEEARAMKKRDTSPEEENIQISARNPLLPDTHLNSSSRQHENKSVISSPPKKISEPIEASQATTVSRPSTQAKVATESVTEQSNGDHHKKKEDALAAAKERYLARKRTKVL